MPCLNCFTDEKTKVTAVKYMPKYTHKVAAPSIGPGQSGTRMGMEGGKSEQSEGRVGLDWEVVAP